MNNTNAIVLINNTGSDLRPFEREIVEAAKAGGTLPEELADLFVLRRVEGNNLAESTGRACWAIEHLED